jgi:hypothetical protein
MALPSVHIEIERTNPPVGEIGAHDISANAFSLTIQRGRSDYTQPFDAGRASVTFRNLNGDLDPDNPSSPFADSLFVGAWFKIIANYSGAVEGWRIDPDARPLFVGLVTGFIVSHDVSGESSVTITAVDTLSLFAQRSIPAGTVYVEQSTSARAVEVIEPILPAIVNPFAVVPGWAGYMFANSDGQSICAAETLADDINALDYMRLIATTEQGEFFARNQGGPFLSDRYWVLRPPILTFTDTTGGSNYQEIERVSSWAQLYNRLQANRTGGSEITRTKTSTVSPLNQVRFLNLGEVLLRGDDEVTDLLDYALVRFTSPIPRIDLLTTYLDDKSGSEQLALMALELTDTVTVNYTPPGIPQLTLPGYVQSISHNYTVGGPWRLTFGFAPRDVASYLVLDDATLGKLDQNALAF